jgi:hypothetical protein
MVDDNNIVYVFEIYETFTYFWTTMKPQSYQLILYVWYNFHNIFL